MDSMVFNKVWCTSHTLALLLSDTAVEPVLHHCIHTDMLFDPKRKKKRKLHLLAKTKKKV